jgi:hypothetical protein
LLQQLLVQWGVTQEHDTGRLGLQALVLSISLLHQTKVDVVQTYQPTLNNGYNAAPQDHRIVFSASKNQNTREQTHEWLGPSVLGCTMLLYHQPETSSKFVLF